jgi:hypothetical protein
MLSAFCCDLAGEDYQITFCDNHHGLSHCIGALALVIVFGLLTCSVGV